MTKHHTLLWFKNDLRLHDNESLINAIESKQKILPVYIFDKNIFQDLPLGFPKSDIVRLQFISQCVNNLRDNLKSIGGNLMIVYGEPETIIPQLTAKYNCNKIYPEQEFATEELIQIDKIKKNLPASTAMNLTWGRTFLECSNA